MKNAYQRLFEATETIRSEVQWSLETPTTGACACCGRAWDAVEQADQAAAYQYSPNMAVEWYCTTCKTVREPSQRALGIERRAGRSDNTVDARLGMLPGAGAVITAHSVLHLAVKPGHWDKFKGGTYAQTGQMHVCSPIQLLLTLERDARLGDPAKGIVYIEEFGRKADGLMADLRVTTSLAELWANTENGPSLIELTRLRTLYDRLAAQDSLDAALKPAFWQPIRRAAQGHLDRDALRAWADQRNDPQAILDALPRDPKMRLSLHSRLATLHAARAA